MLQTQEKEYEYEKEQDFSGDFSAMQTFTSLYRSPIGPLNIVVSQQHLKEIRFGGESKHEHQPTTPLLQEVIAQLDAYFNRSLRVFDLPLAPEGTPFQQKVWQALLQVPYGHTASYRDIALAVGNPKATRAVGGANGRNPIPIVIPCHRIIASDGSLGGYSAGLERKTWLLKHEGVQLPDSAKARF